MLVYDMRFSLVWNLIPIIVFWVNASVLYVFRNYSLVSSKLYDYLLASVKSSRTQLAEPNC